MKDIINYSLKLQFKLTLYLLTICYLTDCDSTVELIDCIWQSRFRSSMWNFIEYMNYVLSHMVWLQRYIFKATCDYLIFHTERVSWGLNSYFNAKKSIWGQKGTYRTHLHSLPSLMCTPVHTVPALILYPGNKRKS